MSAHSSHILKPALTSIPTTIQYAADYEAAARDFIADDIWAYVQEGTEKLHLGPNRQAFDRLQWIPKRLRNVQGGSAQCQLLGNTLPYPLMLAPLAYHGLVHPQGEIAMAQAAAAMQTGFTVSTLSSQKIEDVAAAFFASANEMAVEPAPLWFQLYWQPDIAQNQQLLQRAESAGFSAIVWTVDAHYKRSAFQLPAEVQAVNLPEQAQKKHTTNVLDTGMVFHSSFARYETDWSTLSWLKQHTKLPIIVKGILSADDAVLAKQYGADAIVVSNHGGRVLAEAVSPLTMLPLIRQALNDEAYPLLLDSGIRSGSDIAKVLALGANAVLVGRPQLYALAVAGTLGVAHLLHLLRAELEMTMAQLGCRELAMLSPELLWPSQ